jgi:hypothetical protein
VSDYQPRCDVYGCVKIGDVYELYSKAHSSSVMDNKGVPVSRGTAAPDRSSSDGGDSIGHRRGDRAKVLAAPSHGFDPGSNVTDVSDWQSRKAPVAEHFDRFRNNN